jgi:membrane associated rhomboid family serine protease
MAGFGRLLRQAHLFGALGGILAARLLTPDRTGPPAR